MKRRRRRRSEDKGAAKWLVTYSDMVTLILVFFILLFSMSQIDQAKFEAVTESFQSRVILDFLPSIVPGDHPGDDLDGEGGTDGEGEDVEAGEDEEEDADLEALLEEERLRQLAENMETFERRMAEEQALDELLFDVEAYLEENDLTDSVTADRTEQGIFLVLQESVFFETGEAEILEEGMPFLNELGSMFAEIPNHITVEGHTDSRPINTFRYPSNWELSGARASSVVRYLIEEFDLNDTRFSIAGYGETRELVPNDSEENMSKNRRVEITILNNFLD